MTYPTCCNNFYRDKFFSFENSNCDDYVTEKFFKVLNLDVVPIVFGGANYSEIAPEKSYINAAGFESPKELANYLKYLDQNNTAYAEYFEWKNYFAVDFFTKVFCQLCEALNDEKRPEMTYPNMHKWWLEDASCRVQKLIPTERPLFV